MSAPLTAANVSARHPLLAQLVRLRAWAGDDSHHALARRTAGTAYLIRFGSAAFIYLSQVLLARWMGASEFGVYVYVWTWVLLVGDLIHLGLASAAQRFIPAYTQARAFALLRGFLAGSRWLVLGISSAAALVLAACVWLVQNHLPPHDVSPLYFACAALPAYALSNMLDGIARSYDWIGAALLPPYLLRPLLLLGIMLAGHLLGRPMDASTAMFAAFVACWGAVAVQALMLRRRLGGVVPAGARVYAVRSWLATSLPILMVWGFYTLLTYTDVLVLSQFRPNEEVAHYYAASKTLALVAFVYFSVGAAVAHRFAEYHATGEHAKLAEFVASATRWTFWPSLAATLVMLALGRPVLALFGPAFVAAYPLMFILGAGLLARSAVGPAERLLNMMGEQKACATVYCAAFGTNLVLSVLLAPRYGAPGVAVATATAIVLESVLLFIVARARVGLHVFVLRPRAKSLADSANA